MIFFEFSKKTLNTLKKFIKNHKKPIDESITRDYYINQVVIFEITNREIGRGERMGTLLKVMEALEKMDSTLDELAIILHRSTHELVNQLIENTLTVLDLKAISLYTQTNVYDLFEI